LARQSGGKSQRVIAQDAGMSASQYQLVEQGFYFPTATEWRLICRSLNQPSMAKMLYADEDEIPDEITVKVPRR
jgi:hypothetical protein